MNGDRDNTQDPPELTIDRSVTKALAKFDANRLRWLDEAAALGPLVALRMGPVKVWIVTDPEAGRRMLVGDADAWIRPPATLVPVRLGVGENLFSQPDRRWAQVQPAVAPAFRRKALEARLTEIDAIVDDDVGSISVGAEVDFSALLERVAMRCAAWVILGEELDAARAEELSLHQRAVVQWVSVRLGRLTGFVPLALGAPGREMKRHRAALNAYADEVIARAAKRPAADDVLGALLRARPAGKPLSHDALRGHVLGLLLAGNETTAAALTWAVAHGAANPVEWSRLRARPAARVHAFLDESLRLNPAVWGIPRTPRRAGTVLATPGSTTRVRRGQVTTVYLRGINRDPGLWPDPLRFDPSRHESDGKEARRALIPFGLGPRGCIGQHLAMAEMSAVLPALTRRGDVVVDDEPVENPEFALRVRGGLRGRFVEPVTAPSAQSPDSQRAHGSY
jgi:cytochrome P450